MIKHFTLQGSSLSTGRKIFPGFRKFLKVTKLIKLAPPSSVSTYSHKDHWESFSSKVSFQKGRTELVRRIRSAERFRSRKRAVKLRRRGSSQVNYVERTRCNLWTCVQVLGALHFITFCEVTPMLGWALVMQLSANHKQPLTYILAIILRLWC